MGKLYSKPADSTGSAKNQHALVLFQPPVLEQSLRGSEGGEGYCGTLDVAQGLRLGGQEPGRNRGVLGHDSVPIESGQPVHRLPNRHPVDSGSDGDNDSRQLVGGDGGKALDRPAQFIASDGGGVNPHQHLVGGDGRCIHLLEGQAVDPTWGVQPNRHHLRGRGFGCHGTQVNETVWETVCQTNTEPSRLGSRRAVAWPNHERPPVRHFSRKGRSPTISSSSIFARTSRCP